MPLLLLNLLLSMSSKLFLIIDGLVTLIAIIISLLLDLTFRDTQLLGSEFIHEINSLWSILIKFINVLLNISMHQNQWMELLSLMFKMILSDQEALFEMDELLPLIINFYLMTETQIQWHIFNTLWVTSHNCSSSSVRKVLWLVHLEVSQIMESVCITFNKEITWFLKRHSMLTFSMLQFILFLNIDKRMFVC